MICLYQSLLLARRTAVYRELASGRGYRNAMPDHPRNLAKSSADSIGVPET